MHARQLPVGSRLDAAKKNIDKAKGKLHKAGENLDAAKQRKQEARNEVKEAKKSVDELAAEHALDNPVDDGGAKQVGSTSRRSVDNVLYYKGSSKLMHSFNSALLIGPLLSALLRGWSPQRTFGCVRPLVTY